MLLIKLKSDVPDWMEEANCLEAEDLNDPVEMAPLCSACPVSASCEAYADNKEVKSLIWGGKDMSTGEEV